MDYTTRSVKEKFIDTRDLFFVTTVTGGVSGWAILLPTNDHQTGDKVGNRICQKIHLGRGNHQPIRIHF